MKKSVSLSLIPNDNKEFNADMFHDDKLVKQASLTQSELKAFMESKVPEDEIKNLKLAIKLFKSKKIKLHLK